MAEHSIKAEQLAALDNALADCVAMPLPTWHTQGAGGNLPSRVAHRFGMHSLREGARVDMQRGFADDDLPNEEWNRLMTGLPKYTAWVHRQYGSPLSGNALGNAMEMACGLAYATAHGGGNLPDGQSLTFASEASRELGRLGGRSGRGWA